MALSSPAALKQACPKPTGCLEFLARQSAVWQSHLTLSLPTASSSHQWRDTHLAAASFSPLLAVVEPVHKLCAASPPHWGQVLLPPALPKPAAYG